VKNSAVAIGLENKGKRNPRILAGSGFLLRSHRYVVTASHVIGYFRLRIGKSENTG
jgi:S1-C subfamily serine protease